METEVMKPSPAAEFNFNSACTSPYMSAPGSPQLNSFFFSAPTTPSRFLSFHRDFNTSSGSGAGDSPSAVPFKWEDKPGVPKSKDFSDCEDSDHFEFNFQRHVSASLSAEDFFDSGKIKPLKPPPRLQLVENGIPDSPKSPRSPIYVNILKEVLSPRNKNNDFDPFSAAIEQTRREIIKVDSNNGNRQLIDSLRVCDILATETRDPIEQHSFSSSSSSSANRNRKWKLKDLFTFKNASSDERAKEEDSFKKYGLLRENSRDPDVKNSTERRKGAASEELKRKTLLTYKQGILGCLGLNPNVNHKISRTIGSISRTT